MRILRKCLPGILIIVTVAGFVCFNVVSIFAKQRLKLATTTSTENTGLFYVLLPPFEKKFNIRIDIISVGTGKALRLGENGDVDVVLVHAKELEDKFIKQGYGINRRDVMYNDFIIVGPKHDPAGIKGLKDASIVFRKIAVSGYNFVSRGDNSGTHVKEKFLWNEAGIQPGGNWYMESGQGMVSTLIIAGEKEAYCLIDRATFLTLRHKIQLILLNEGDERFLNQYGIIAVNPYQHERVNYTMAMAFIGWITSVEGQNIIGEFRKGGQVLFHPNANNERENGISYRNIKTSNKTSCKLR